jgi:hypothetical protein
MIAPPLASLCPWETAGMMEAEPLDQVLQPLRRRQNS